MNWNPWKKHVEKTSVNDLAARLADRYVCKHTELAQAVMHVLVLCGRDGIDIEAEIEAIINEDEEAMTK